MDTIFDKGYQPTDHLDTSNPPPVNDLENNIMSKDDIKKIVVQEVDKLCKNIGQYIEFQTEGSCTEDIRMFRRNELNAALELCFETTYNTINKL